ncbi:MAG: RsmB/NOP family class I SAM-dependent RNA methyltransferase [Pseudomonadota bacterium]|nr:RsmB/NOP family class I SAM-dependent RNA methyltransferase [Pseudomonadota bacterium]
MPPNHPAIRKNAGAQRPPPPEATPGYLPRWVAAQAISDALTLGKPLDDRFPGPDGDAPPQILDARDRALARSIATVAMRRLGTIRKALGRYLEKGMPRKSGPLESTLIAASAQLLFLDASDHAAVDLAVRAVRADPASAPYIALANAVLRNIGRAKDEILGDAEPLDDAPAWLAARWRAHYGEETLLAIAAAHRCEPTLDLTVKSDPEGWAQKLGGVVLPTGSVRIEPHTPIPDLPGFSDGEWWVQDAAAALPAMLLPISPGDRVVDLCAAPGGKTAQLAARGARVFALDRSAHRLKRVAANLERLKLEAELVIANAATYEAAPFDAALVDAPCSSTGTIRRHPDVAWTKRSNDITALAKTQAELLARAVLLTRKGGTIVYSTCSLEPEEGEAQIAALLRRQPDVSREPIRADEIGGLAECITPLGDLRTLPCHLQAATARQSGLDGFFAARLRKN